MVHRSVAASLTLLLSISSAGLGGRALYEADLPGIPHPKQVAMLEIAVSPNPDPAGGRWFRLSATKINGDSLTLWFLTHAKPFSPASEKDISIERYILQEPGESPVEYVDRRTGKALVPVFGFAENLLPRGPAEPDRVLFEKGTYLGHPLVRRKELAPVKAAPPSSLRKLSVRSDLLIGTSRNFRDDGAGRKTKKANYTYVPFTEDDYDEMIAAGINYFRVAGEQVAWVRKRPVFYEGYDPDIAFPEELYRPSFRGLRMYLDEPACRLAGEYPPGSSLGTAVEMIHEHIAEQIHPASYHEVLTRSGIDLGTLMLVEPDIPIWETYVATSYYQLEANPCGIVQECRWRIDPNADSQQILMLQRINETFGVDIPVTPENLFLWFYSQMRGPARAFGCKWGMSIYGQAEPHLRLPSMKLAYDQGAEFIWFWTSDHDHHVPYREQLRLARQITDYAASRPPRDLDQRRRAAKVAIVIPYGYTLPTSWQLFTWGTHIYPLDRKNQHDLTYKEVLTPAVREIARCLKEHIPYDVVPAGERFDPSGHERVVWIGENGKVGTTP